MIRFGNFKCGIPEGVEAALPYTPPALCGFGKKAGEACLYRFSPAGQLLL